MLVLSRKPGEKILVGDNVVITIVRIGPNTVRIGIEAPRDMKIVREELRTPSDDTVSDNGDEASGNVQFIDVAIEEIETDENAGPSETGKVEGDSK